MAHPVSVFYVYVHYDSDGVPFYVGKGTGKRWYPSRRRSPAYRAVVLSCGGPAHIGVEMIRCESAIEALILELMIIRDYQRAGVFLVNNL